MPISKDKRYIHTILYNFLYLTAILIDAARRLYHIFHRKIHRIVCVLWAWNPFHGRDLETVLWTNVNHMGNTLSLKTTKLGYHRAARQHNEKMLSTFCAKTGIVNGTTFSNLWSSVIISVNVTVISWIGTNHTGRHPNIGLSNQPHEDITNSDPEAYGMHINSLLRQVHQRVALANNEAGHRMDAKQKWLRFASILWSLYKIVSDSSHLFWLSNFEVTKTNEIILQVRNEMAKPTEFTTFMSFASYRDRIICNAQTFLVLQTLTENTAKQINKHMENSQHTSMTSWRTNSTNTAKQHKYTHPFRSYRLTTYESDWDLEELLYIASN